MFILQIQVSFTNIYESNQTKSNQYLLKTADMKIKKFKTYKRIKKKYEVINKHLIPPNNSSENQGFQACSACYYHPPACWFPENDFKLQQVFEAHLSILFAKQQVEVF